MTKAIKITKTQTEHTFLINNEVKKSLDERTE